VIIRDFIAVSDMHLRHDKPRCRKDEDWMRTQRKSLLFIADKANEKNVPIIIAGDIFDRAIVPEEVLNLFIDFCKAVKTKIYIICGNHDLPQHSIENLDKSAIGVLLNISSLTEKLKTLDGIENVSYANFGKEVEFPDREVIVLHTLTYKDEAHKPPFIKAYIAQDLLDMYPKANVIVVGDGHRAFNYMGKDNRVVLNPGHMNIQKNSELSEPIMFYISLNKNMIEDIALPNEGELITDDYIKKEEEREERISSFVEKIKSHDTLSLSFEDNIESEILINEKTLGERVITAIHMLMKGE